MFMDQTLDTSALQEFRDLQQHTRTQLRAFWFPLILFGGLSILSAPLAEMGEGQALGIFWLIAGPVGGGVTGLYFHRRELRVGAGRNGLPYIITALGILVGTSAAGWFGGVTGRERLSQYGPPLVVAVAYLVFARLEKSIALAALSSTWLVLTVTLTLTDPARGTGYLAAGFGISAISLGLYFRQQDQS